MKPEPLRTWALRAAVVALALEAVWGAYVSPLWRDIEMHSGLTELSEREPELARLARAGPSYRAALNAINRQVADSVGASQSPEAIEATVRSTIEASGGSVQSFRLRRTDTGCAGSASIALPPDALEAWLAGLEYGKPPFLLKHLGVRRLTEAASGSNRLEIVVSGDWVQFGEAEH